MKTTMTAEQQTKALQMIEEWANTERKPELKNNEYHDMYVSGINFAKLQIQTILMQAEL